MEQVTLPRAKGIVVQAADDGRHTAVCFRTGGELIGAVVPDEDVSRLAALLINRARDVAAKVAPEKPPAEFTTTPIMASHVGIGSGRLDSEAMVTFKVGNLLLTFAVEIGMLQEQCRALLAATKAAAKPRKVN